GGCDRAGSRSSHPGERLDLAAQGRGRLSLPCRRGTCAGEPRAPSGAGGGSAIETVPVTRRAASGGHRLVRRKAGGRRGEDDRRSAKGGNIRRDSLEQADQGSKLVHSAHAYRSVVADHNADLML